IVDGAERYLRNGSPNNERWMGSTTEYFPAWAGYRAVRLLWQERRRSFDRLPVEIWEKWTGILLAWWVQDDRDSDFRPDALRCVQQHAPCETHEIGTRLLEGHGFASSIHIIKGRLGPLWDPTVDETVKASLRKRSLDAYEVSARVEHLVSIGDSDVRSWA